MRKVFTILSVFVLIFFLFSCSGKKKTEELSDFDQLTGDLEESDDKEVQDDGDLKDDIAEPDDEVDDDGGETPVVNPCDPNPCNEPNRSVCELDGFGGYKCLCDKFTCEIDGECFKEGELNPFDSCYSCNRVFSDTQFTVRSDGSECMAIAGIMGSGICRNGLCGGFGNCDARAYGQGPGYPCNYDSECATGRCTELFDWANGATIVHVCTGICEKDEDCPGDMLCQYSNEFGYECVPRFTSTIIKPDPLMADYKPCNKNEDCDGGMCLAYGSARFCSKNCERKSGGGKDLLACGSCGTCNDNGDELKFKHKYYCVPDGSGKTGANCQSGIDCSSKVCYDNYCTAGCATLSPCPSGYQCMEDVYKAGTKACIDKSRLNIADGFPCSFDYQCVSEKCLEFPYGKYCSTECDEEEPCSIGECVQIGNPKDNPPKMACAPLFMPGYLNYGDRCKFDWQCESGFECQEELLFCTKECEGDEVCDGGNCFEFGPDFNYCVPDHLYKTKQDGYYLTYGFECINDYYVDYDIQRVYCSSSCENDSDCFDMGGCHENICLHAYPWRTYSYGLCRFDSDCEKFTFCKEGFCTSECTTDSGCDGFAAINPVGNQKTCKSCKYDTDCKNLFYDLGQCMTAPDGARFCVEDCTDDPSLCPEGTRCYGVGSGGVCFPLSGFCEEGFVTCGNGKICIKGRFQDGWACNENGECVSGICKNGTCQAGTCSKNSDCDCDMLECKGGNCLPKESAGVKEVEPNDTVGQAQTIAGSSDIIAYFNHSGNERDVDIFKVSLKKGKYLNVRTHPFCGHNADTYLRFLDSKGDLIGKWQNEDISSGWYFSELLEYVAQTDEDIFIEVTQSELTPEPQSTPYLLEVLIFDPISNSACENAEVLTEGTHEKSMKKAINSIESGSCSGGYGYGPNLYYKVNVPAGKLLTFRVTPESDEFNPELSLLSGCGPLKDECLTGNAFGNWGEPEEVSFVNSSGAAKDYIVLLDTPMMPFNYDFIIQIDISDANIPVNDKIAGAIELSGTGTIEGTTVGAVDDYAPEEGICKGYNLSGPDVVYSIDLKAGEYFHIEIIPTFGASIYLLKSDDLDTCISGGGTIQHKTDTDELLYLIIDSPLPSRYGNFRVNYKIGTTGPCEGLCDTADHRECSDETNLCMCDTETGLLKPTDCNEFCVTGNGALTGGCKSNEKGNGCVCDFDCSDTAKVAELCEESTISNCTCSAADPCKWVKDGICNVYCADFFPLDHFDDSVDCAPKP
ncbi:MAG: hypothetical protein ACOX2F_02040 [bacterium]